MLETLDFLLCPPNDAVGNLRSLSLKASSEAVKSVAAASLVLQADPGAHVT